MSLLSVENLSVSIHGTEILRDVSLSVEAGQIVGVIGESGSGKSMTALAVMQLLPDGAVATGRVALGGHEMLTLEEGALCGLRGNEVGMVFQEPMTALNPIQTIGAQVAETVLIHENVSRREAMERAREALRRCELPEERFPLSRYPHELSGGQRQRVVIAMAIALQPKLLIADEPTTALDVTVQAQIFDLLNEIQREFGAAIILITHDMGAISEMADRVAVMYAGRVIEEASADSVLDTPQHPYARRLIDCIPTLGKGDTALKEIPGVVPPLHLLGAGCAFAARCAHADARCLSEKPLLANHGHHPSACHAVEEARI